MLKKFIHVSIALMMLVSAIGLNVYIVEVVAAEDGLAIVVDHVSASEFHDIPDYWIEKAKEDLHIAYQHTSHGSQLVRGMSTLRSFPAFAGMYLYSSSGLQGLDFDYGGIPGAVEDLSQGDYIDEFGVTPWVTSTRNLLDNPDNYHVNVIMWSWCSINGHNIPRYLENMEILVSEYGVGGSKPRAAEYPVDFVFMTGHAQGQGEGGFIHTANEQIRAHCIENNRVLFDFADIENYDPDGAYYYDKPMWDDLDYNPDHANNWGQEWCLANQGSELEQLTTGIGVDGYDGCNDCAHSSVPQEANLNCVLKGEACWWMFARLAGWDESEDVTECNDGIDNDGDGLIDWQYDCGCSDANDTTEAALSREEEDGWTTFDPSSDTRIVLVANNPGQEETDICDGYVGDCYIVTNVDEGKALIRDGYPDWLLFKRGDEWTDETLGAWTTDGRSPSEKQLISSYGISTVRPKFNVGKSGTWFNYGGSSTGENIAIVGMHVYGYAKDPAHPLFSAQSNSAVQLLRDGGNFLFEDNRVEYMQVNLQRDPTGLHEIRRNVLSHSYSILGHAQSMFTSIAAPLLIEENVFYHGGWNDDFRLVITSPQNDHSVWQGVSDGRFRIELPVEPRVGQYFDVTGVDFSGVGSMTDVASVLENAINNAGIPGTVSLTWTDGEVFMLQSEDFLSDAYYGVEGLSSDEIVFSSVSSSGVRWQGIPDTANPLDWTGFDNAQFVIQILDDVYATTDLDYHYLDGVDFSGVGSMADVASLLDTVIDARMLERRGIPNFVDVSWDGTYIIIDSNQGEDYRVRRLQDNRIWNFPIGGGTDIYGQDYFDFVFQGVPESTVFNRNMYLSYGYGNTIVRGNIDAYGASGGVQLRMGGVMENNLFLRDSLAGGIGHNENPEGSVTRGRITDNVVLGAKDIDTQVQGTGLGAGISLDTRFAEDILISGNIIAHNLLGNGNVKGFLMRRGDNITITNNILYNWKEIDYCGGWGCRGTGISIADAPTNSEISNNIIQQVDGGTIYNVNGVDDISGVEFSNNRYFTTNDVDYQVAMNGGYASLGEWLTYSGESGSTFGEVDFVDSTRDIDTYHASIGGEESFEGFMDEALKQSKFNWRTEYTADSVNGYIREGFQLKDSGVNDPPTISDEAPSDGATDVSIDLNSLSVTIEDPESDDIDWTIETSPDIGSDSASGDENGTKSCSISGLIYTMQYAWYVNATDGGNWTREVFTFTTENEPNTPPVAADDEATVEEDSSNNQIDVLANDEDPDEDDLEIIDVSDPAHGLASSDGAYVYYTPDADYFGIDSFSYTIDDGHGGTDSAVVTVTVTAVNDVPVVSDIPNQTRGDGGGFASIYLDEYVSDVDDADEDIIWSYSGNVELEVNITDRVVIITVPYSNWWGQEIITFTATDSGGLSDSDDATFTVLAINNRPSITGPSIDDLSDGIGLATSSLSIVIEDPEGDLFNWSIETSHNIGSSSGVDDSNGSKSCSISGLSYSVTYNWIVRAIDSGSGNWTNVTYMFTTEPKPSGGSSDDGSGGGGSSGGSTVIPDEDPKEDPNLISDAGGPYSGLVNQTIFLNGSLSTPKENITSYLWDLGDGSNGSGELVNHTYNQTGNYTITLTIIDLEDRTVNDTTYVNITEEIIEIDEIEEQMGKTYVINQRNLKGRLIDTDNNGIHDQFYNDITDQVTNVITTNDGDSYLIDENGDGNWDYMYNPASDSVTQYREINDNLPSGIPWIWLSIGFLGLISLAAIAIYIWKNKKP